MPSECFFGRNVLMATEDDGLGFVNSVSHWHRLCLWSREAGPDKDARWVQSRTIDLKALLPKEALSTFLHVAGFAYGISVIFVRTDVGIFTIDLKSCQAKKVYKYGRCNYNLRTPALRAAFTEGPRIGTSVA
ncbi:hypothetical protein U9M48_032171 [Paspalum notatum var. saurae]|uniref:Uncharacterized protein n=1 Tax=Paspalum notatum var. saurae TaxID=547442 RepID=A0AAQ3U4Y7_PASNO